MAILVVLILPLPTWLLDLSLAFSLSFSILILMTAVFIRKPLEFSSFPTILLITTMLRLALNLASTRLILGHGNEGTAASGYVIQAFGKLIMQGNFVIGLIVFAILVIVNFVVITKGSGRIAEVAARFSLDAMPGKQMAIDADLSAGLIDEKEAKSRRKTIEAESNFFGAMDGASKFVRGDAIAGLLIVAINIVGGIIIGVAQKGMSFGDASQTFTLLTVGDGLVSQMPALIVSTAAGLMVSKAGVEGATDKALMGQLSFYPQALGMAAAVMGIVAVLPGMPTIVFALLSGGTGSLAWYAHKRKNQRTAEAAAEDAKADGRAQGRTDLQRPGPGPAAHRTGLWPPAPDQRCAGPPHHRPDQGAAPPAGAGDGLRHARGAHPGQYAAGRQRVPHPRQGIRFRQGRAFPRLLPDHGPQGPAHRPARHPHHRARLRPARHLGHRQPEGRSLLPRLHRGGSRHGADHASDRSAEDPYGGAALLCGDQEAAGRSAAGEQEAGGRTDPLADFRHRRAARAADPAVASASPSATCRPSWKASPRPSATPRTRSTSPSMCGRAWPASSATPICRRAAICRWWRCRRHWEQAFAESIVGQGEERQLAMAPSQLQQFIQQVREAFDEASSKNEVPVLLTSPQIRPFVRSIIERFRAPDGGDEPERNPCLGAAAHAWPGLRRRAMGPNANLVAFPGPILRALLGTAMKRHRLPENLGQALVREAANFPEVSADAALACAISQRLSQAPIDLQTARGILLVGPARRRQKRGRRQDRACRRPFGRKVAITRADIGLGLFRTNSNPPEILTIMEADGFNPLNTRAASAFRALGEIEGVETIGVISALHDAEDVSDLVAAFRFPRVIVTHMDLTRRLGAALAAAMSGASSPMSPIARAPRTGWTSRPPGALAAQMLEIASALKHSGFGREQLALFPATFRRIVDGERPRPQSHHQQQPAANREIADEHGKIAPPAPPDRCSARNRAARKWR